MSRLRQLDPASVHRIEFDMQWPPWSVCAYLISTDEPILVDAGLPGDGGWSRLTDGLASVGYAPEDVDHLLVTHPHSDHIGQIADLIDVADPTIYAPTGVRERLARDPNDLAETVRDNATEAGIPDVERTVEWATDSLRRERSWFPPEEIDVEVRFDEPFSVAGVRFRPIHAPGHQADQAAYLAGDTLLAGDALVVPFRPAAIHAGFDHGCRDGVDAYYEGLDRLADLEKVDRVYPSHGPDFEDVDTVVADTRSDLDAFVEACRHTLAEQGPSTSYEVTTPRIDDHSSPWLEFSTIESVGALARLERRGVVESTLEDGVRTYRTPE